MNNEKINLLFPFKIGYKMMTLSETVNYGNKMHNIPEMWKKTKGNGILIGVIDTGLPVHRDLKNQIVDSINFTESPIEDKIVGHGTHVAGVIAAEENGEGVVGIAPKAKLVIAKALGDDGSGSDEWLANAIYWCIDKKVDIINMSLGAPAEYDHAFPQTKQAVVDAYNKGIIIVCASGNENADKVGIPAKYKETFSVMAVNSKEERASFSNRGERLDFAAAGVDILSTFKNETFASLSGTSMACPQIAGIVALILSEHKSGQEKDTPINNPEDMREHIRKICVDLGNIGFDVNFGNGLPVFGKIEENNPPIIPPKPPIIEPVKKKNWFWKIIDSLFGNF